jgi:hypothetical protein
MMFAVCWGDSSSSQGATGRRKGVQDATLHFNVQLSDNDVWGASLLHAGSGYVH